MNSLQTLYPQLFAVVEKAHEGVHGGHDIHHAVRVATWAHQIALDEWNDEAAAKLAWIAGICHNADRLLERQYGRGKAPEGATTQLLESWLATEPSLTREEKNIVITSVMGHNKENDSSHSRVQIALMDGDKATNAAADLIIRSGQLHPDLPAVDCIHYVSDPKATYQNPKSCLKDIWYSPKEWCDPKNPFCFRTKLGWAVGRERAAFLNEFIRILRAQLVEDGIEFKN